MPSPAGYLFTQFSIMETTILLQILIEVYQPPRIDSNGNLINSRIVIAGEVEDLAHVLRLAMNQDPRFYNAVMIAAQKR